MVSDIGQGERRFRHDDEAPLYEMMRDLDYRFRQHMDAEEAGMKIIQDDMIEIRDELRSVATVIHAIPRIKDTDIPDFYGHRADHDLLREQWKSLGKVKSRIVDKGVDLLFLALIVLLATGKISDLFTLMLKFMGP